MNNSNNPGIVEHHVKYKEIHGVDETVLITRSEHSKLHAELRKRGECNIPPEELAKISMAAHNRTETAKKARLIRGNKWQKAHPELHREKCKKCMRNLRERDREAYNRYMREYRARKKAEKNKEV